MARRVVRRSLMKGSFVEILMLMELSVGDLMPKLVRELLGTVGVGRCVLGSWYVRGAKHFPFEILSAVVLLKHVSRKSSIFRPKEVITDSPVRIEEVVDDYWGGGR